MKKLKILDGELNVATESIFMNMIKYEVLLIWSNNVSGEKDG